MALGCRRRSAARGDVTVPCLRSPCCRALRPAVPRRLIASHAEITAPRSSSALVWRRSSKQGSDPRRSPLREVSWGWSHASDANETRRPARAGGAGQRDRRASGRAREKRCPTLGSDRNVAQQHARAATSQQRRAGLPTASTPQRPAPRPSQQPSRRAAHSKHARAATSQQPSQR